MQKPRVVCGRCKEEVFVVDARITNLWGVLQWVCVTECGGQVHAGKDGVTSARIG